MSGYGAAVGTQQRGPWPVAYVVVVGVLAAGGALLNLLLCYVAIFATDDCGIHRPDPLRCTGGGLLLMWGLPWAGLVWAVGTALAVAARRRGLWPWCGLPLGALVYAAGLALAWRVVVA
ncbi:hypothetical protein ABZX97_11285 [Streptomyces seoulensis]|uniref:hypothetical protein n=1 Tax=Streptomyces seoulensis TaxID=73044 RepID=UPI0033B1BDBD